MSEDKLFWFHCGRCGAMFQAGAGLSDERVCAVCGVDPCLPAVETSAVVPAVENGPAALQERTKRGSRRKKHSHLMLKLVLGWTLVLVLIVFGARRLWHASPPQTAAVAEEKPVILTDEDVRLMQTAGQKCSRVFEGFLAAGTPEQRNQFVLSPVITVSKMARFYSMNPLPAIKPEKLSLSGSGLLHLPGGKRAFEALWESQEGGIYDTVFRMENDEWRLDWEHFARYSDYPWPLFIAGSGPDEGEFRLLARERLAEERKAEPSISLVFYAPRFGSPREAGFQSPEFLVARDTPAGQLLDAAFKLAREGGRVFNSQLEDINPDGMIRVRVRVRRIEEDLERRFEIADVIACHWHAVDDPGVEPLKPETPEDADTQD